jgi:SAM-dependent methyltransferase
MKIGDLEQTSRGRHFLNTYLVPRTALILENGSRVLFVGTDTPWDYKPFFWNPSKQCEYITMEPVETLPADIHCRLEQADTKIKEGTMDLVILIGMWEYFENKQDALNQVLKMLKPNGYVVIAFPGVGYGMVKGADQVEPTEIWEILKDFQILESYYLREDGKNISSICVLAQKVV